ncbi:MAG: cobalamin B12-binding domain-containing protein [Alphaproteobacteria bacterium]
MNRGTTPNFTLDYGGGSGSYMSERQAQGRSKALRRRIDEGTGDAESRAIVTRTIEADIVPRLLLVARERAGASAVDATTRFSDQDVAEFARLVCNEEVEQAASRVAGLRASGLEISQIFRDLLIPTALNLGERWERDEESFLGVTIGLCRLEQVVRELSTSYDRSVEPSADTLHILMALCPGEQHRFGLLIIQEYLRLAGLDVISEFEPDSDVILSAVRDEWYDVIGISLSTPDRIPVLKSLINSIRHESCNPHIHISVGGFAIGGDEDIARALGADSTAIDAPQIVGQMQQLRHELQSRHMQFGGIGIHGTGRDDGGGGNR